jgi:hypothetical protein
MLKALTCKVDSMEECMDNIRREMEILRKNWKGVIGIVNAISNWRMPVVIILLLTV